VLTVISMNECLVGDVAHLKAAILVPANVGRTGCGYEGPLWVACGCSWGAPRIAVQGGEETFALIPERPGRAFLAQWDRVHCGRVQMAPATPIGGPTE
jgi:hypothetical protein